MNLSIKDIKTLLNILDMNRYYIFQTKEGFELYNRLRINLNLEPIKECGYEKYWK